MSISQEASYRLKVVKFAKRFGVLRATAAYHTSKSCVYRWIKIYNETDGDPEAFTSRSRRPHNCPNTHTAAEIKLIRDMRRRNPNIGLQDLWLKLRKRGYTRTMSGLYKELEKLDLITRPKSSPSPTCNKNKPYEQMTYPGERVQIDVKYVPRACLDAAFVEQHGSSELYQYTAIDEYSRYRILWGSREHNTYASATFLAIVISALKQFGTEVECVQIDNGSEFTKTFHAKNENNHSMFEALAISRNIKIKHIKPGTPKHNGKVERSHREDQKNFYSEMIRLHHLILDEESFQARLKRYQDKSNHRPMRPLGYKTPMQMMREYRQQHPKDLDKPQK